ncbi:MAG: class I SAM-dependent methyltransferase [Selenomonadaceae bacterium]|nr:class I SAM-dependent methyltransferase [Selenomonadaceae bacterium]
MPPAESDENSAHCELGYGQGLSINIHAAATQGKYFDTDFNPSHAAHANELCTASKCGAKFFDDSFEEMLHRDDLPQFDSISLHGIWSWISEENQAHIVEFARKFLKPGGVFYNSYNCYPGWSPGAPLRELFILHDKYAHKSSKTFNRVEEALKFTEELLNKNPAYFQRVPDVKNVFNTARKLSHDYLAHEYFNRDWICMYFSEVAEILQAAKLDFACTTEIVETLDNYNFSQDNLAFINGIENSIMREQIKDYFRNRQFRKDIYIRGARRLPEFERVERILSTNYVLMTKDKFPQSVAVPAGNVTLTENVAEKIYNYLAAEDYAPKNFKAFLEKNPDISKATMFQAIVLLMRNGNIMPCQSEVTIQHVKPYCVNLNKYICKRAYDSDDLQFLANPVTGGGFPLTKMERVFLAAEYEGITGVDELANYAWKIFSARGLSLVKAGKSLNGAEENLAEFKNMAQSFTENRLPILKALQII